MTVPCILVVATEASGDALGAGLIAEMRRRLGGRVRFVGVGAARMREAGIASPFDPASIALLGVFNAAAAYPRVLARLRETTRLAARERPVAAILIDSWGFNLRLARALRRLDPGMMLIKYVGPQIWATRPGRARTLAGVVDHLLTIHAFDAPLFRAAGLPTTFVAVPALDALTPRDTRGEGGCSGSPSLLLLPGSRIAEIDRLMPVFGDAAARLSALHPSLVVQVGAADGHAPRVRAAVERWTLPATILEDEASRATAMGSATAALACSGSVTTELALAGCPMVVAYKLDPLTHAVARRLLRTDHITLINIAANARVAPEFVQGACTGPALAGALDRLLSDEAARRAQVEAQTRALAALRGGDVGAAPTAAATVIDLLSLQ